MNLLRKKQQKAERRRVSNVQHVGRASSAELDERYAFRRNRTLTGSLSSGVSSVNEQRAELKSARIHAHDLRKHRRQLMSYVFATCVVVALIGWVLFESIAVPTVVIADLTHDDRHIDYAKKVQPYLDAHPLQRLRATLDTNQLAHYLQENGCPEVESVSPHLTFAGIGMSRMTLTMRHPAVVWKTGTVKLYVDVNGHAFQTNYYDEPNVEVVDQTGIQTNNNQVLASNRFLGFIGRTIGRFESQGFDVTKVVLPANTTRQLLLSINNIAYPVRISVDRPAGEQAEDAARAIRYLDTHGISAQYVDVRVSGKAYYK